jgi:glycogen debranching enzyme
MGPFVTGYLKVYGKDERTKEVALGFLKTLFDHLNDACIGSISEIFEGDYPHWPKGCFAQAWSVGEILRVYKELIS